MPPNAVSQSVEVTGVLCETSRARDRIGADVVLRAHVTAGDVVRNDVLFAFKTPRRRATRTLPEPVRPLSHIYAIMIDDARPTPASSTLTLPHR
jgi:hypothetical protein